MIIITYFFMAKHCHRQHSSVDHFTAAVQPTDHFTAAVQPTDHSQCHCFCY